MKMTHPSQNPNLSARIMKSVRARGRGSAFTAHDFAALGSSAAVGRSLARLARRGTLRRVARGLYDWPQTVASLGITTAPDTRALVEALARHDGARIVPGGAQAANQLGLSTQVPARDLYLSTGGSHRIAVGRSVILVRHAPRRLTAGSDGAALALSALAYIGPRDVDGDDIARLRQVLAPRDKAALRRAMPRTYAWMRPILSQITAS